MSVDRSSQPAEASFFAIPNTEELAERLRANAANYYPECDQTTTAKLLKKQIRINSQIYWFALRTAGIERKVIVKRPYSSRESRDEYEGNPAGYQSRPRLRNKPPAPSRGLFEYRALKAIEQYFTELGDPRFGTIRALDLWPTPYTIVMEQGADPNLRHQFRKMHRFGASRLKATLQESFANSGRWLHHFHAFPPMSHTTCSEVDHASFVTSVKQFVQYLVACGESPTLLEKIQTQLIRATEQVLPSQLPLGLVHGDYAPRNILCSPDNRVTVFDTHGSWEAPIYTDIAHFVLAVKASGPHLSTGGLLYSPSVLADQEQAFLAGYFGSAPVPLATIRMFECQRLLEWWAALCCRCNQAKGIRRHAKAFRLRMWRPPITQLILKYLNVITSNSTTHKAHVCV